MLIKLHPLNVELSRSKRYNTQRPLHFWAAWLDVCKVKITTSNFSRRFVFRPAIASNICCVSQSHATQMRCGRSAERLNTFTSIQPVRWYWFNACDVYHGQAEECTIPLHLWYEGWLQRKETGRKGTGKQKCEAEVRVLLTQNAASIRKGSHYRMNVIVENHFDWQVERHPTLPGRWRAQECKVASNKDEDMSTVSIIRKCQEMVVPFLFWDLRKTFWRSV
jgi:hypothetical protein